MIVFFYNLALLAALLLSAPWWLWRMATTHKYRAGLLERLGRIPRQRLGLHSAEPSDARPVLWLHAVSVGEVLAVTRLVAELEQALPGYRLLISTTTRTGQELARARFGAGRVFYCPLDLPWAVRACHRALRPRLFLLAETEFWPNLLTACFRRGIPVAVVNARISDRSWPRYHRLRGLWRGFLERLSCVLAQSELDAERLRALGCAAPRVHVAGNLKYDVRAPQQSEAVRLLAAQGSDLRFVVAGSTLQGEEAALLQAWPHLLAADPRLALVLAPRHPERFNEVAALLEQSGFGWRRRSQWGAPARSLQPGEIILLDTIGELASLYSLAAVAFVGGSLVPAGGHNPLEPAQFSVPVVMGPHTNNFRAIVDDLLAHDALRSTTPEELAGTLLALLRDRAAAQALGERGRAVFDRQAGATGRCVQALCDLLAQGSAMGARP